MEGLKVKCQTCGCTDLYETSEHYNPNIPLTGDMLRLQEPYSKFNWGVYDGALAVKSTSRFLMFCTRCGGYITIDGNLSFVDPSIDINKTIAETEYVEVDILGNGLDAKDENELLADEKLTAEIIEESDSFICPECGKVCASKAGLMAHIRLTHKEK